jgi:hemerythrin-like metal-binding protein
MALQWDASLSVGIELVDEQHQELFRQVNGLLDALAKGQAKEELCRLLTFLGKYTIDHFGAEERLMSQYKYPLSIAHKKQHSDFIDAFLKLKVEFDKRGSTGEVSMKLDRFVCQWLREHIGGSDVALGEFLRGAGAKETRA